MDKKKKLIIEIALFILLLLSVTVIYNYLTNKDNKEYTQGNSLEKADAKEDTIMEIEDTKQFEKEVINESGIVFIDFYATWCMPCKAMSPIIEEISKEHKEVKFVKIDVDKNEELAIKYNVMSIPTMLVIKNGEVTKTYRGITNKENIVEGLK